MAPLLAPMEGKNSQMAVRQNRIIIGLTVLVVILTAALVYSACRPIPAPTTASQVTIQSTSTDLALADCLSQADVEYDQRWNALCADMGQPKFCNAFVGSPKDMQFVQVRDQEKDQCMTLYK